MQHHLVLVISNEPRTTKAPLGNLSPPFCKDEYDVA